MKRNKKGVTGLELLMVTFTYILAVTILFSFMPADVFGDYVLTTTIPAGGTASYNDSATDDTEFETSFNTLSFVGDLLTFGVSGFPVWLNLIAVYLPLVMLGFAIYTLIRGGS